MRKEARVRHSTDQNNDQLEWRVCGALTPQLAWVVCAKTQGRIPPLVSRAACSPADAWVAPFRQKFLPRCSGLHEQSGPGAGVPSSGGSLSTTEAGTPTRHRSHLETKSVHACPNASRRSESRKLYSLIAATIINEVCEIGAVGLCVRSLGLLMPILKRGVENETIPGNRGPGCRLHVGRRR